MTERRGSSAALPPLPLAAPSVVKEVSPVPEERAQIQRRLRAERTP